MKQWYAGALVVASVMSSGCASPMLGKAAPDFELTALDGSKVKLSSFRGKPVLLGFWAVG